MSIRIANYSFLLLILIFLPVTLSWAGKIYKWVDEDGVTQFSTYPPLVQKPEQNITTVKGLKTAKSSSALNREDLYGVWFIIEKRKKHTLTFYKDSFSYRPQESKTGWGLASSGSWKLEDGVVELNYKQHKDKAKKNTKEQFFVKKTDEYAMTLFANEGRKRFNFRKDTNLLKADKAKSRLAQNLIGFWSGLGGGDSISFSNETFDLKGKRKEKFSGDIRDSVGTKYKGRWQVDDPYITLEITLDEVYKLEETQSQVGKEWRWLIVKKTADTLAVRDPYSRRLRKFIKTTD